jgi:hypothetical protein
MFFINVGNGLNSEAALCRWSMNSTGFQFIVRGSHNISLKVLDSMPVRLFKFAFYSVDFGDEQYP